MASLNKVILIGTLGRDPETRYMNNGDAVTQLSVATSEKWKDKNSGEVKEATEWHRVTLFRKLAEIAGQYLKKGAQVYIEGKLNTRKWTDKDGVERYTTEIVADEMKMLSKPQQSGNDGGGQHEQPQQRQQQQRQQRQTPNFSDMDDDIPFMNPYFGKYALAV